MDQEIETMGRCANILSCAMAAIKANETDDPEVLAGASLISLVHHVAKSRNISICEAKSVVYPLVAGFINKG